MGRRFSPLAKIRKPRPSATVNFRVDGLRFIGNVVRAHRFPAGVKLLETAKCVRLTKGKK